ncbi:MAG TPA: HPr(Ser) kinase/phosphatase [Candidatus Limiplasma sp.]|nr:HPr(Ser) kinase/phosphatase [Candidatus Limiplasma sp.]
MIKIADFAKALDLKVLHHSTKEEMNITLPDLNRPGMQFFGFYEYFSHERLQVIGKAEMNYLESLTTAQQHQILDPFMRYPLPGIVICWGMATPKELLSLAQQYDIPVLQSSKKTTVFTLQAITYLSRQLAPHETRHGVLVDVFGVGVLITGESGVGKSEAALELVKRGHQLCADDVVDICRVSDDRLIGESPETIRHFMEIRGIGIIDIRAMYGVGAITLSKTIDMVIHLEKWDQVKEYDRLGLTEETTEIMNVSVPYQVMPVRPGRNLAIIIEVAARNLSLRRLGYSAASELDRRLSDMMMNSAKEDSE